MALWAQFAAQAAGAAMGGAGGAGGAGAPGGAGGGISLAQRAESGARDAISGGPLSFVIGAPPNPGAALGGQIVTGVTVALVVGLLLPLLKKKR